MPGIASARTSTSRVPSLASTMVLSGADATPAMPGWASPSAFNARSAPGWISTRPCLSRTKAYEFSLGLMPLTILTTSASDLSAPMTPTSLPSALTGSAKVTVMSLNDASLYGSVTTGLPLATAALYQGRDVGS